MYILASFPLHIFPSHAENNVQEALFKKEHKELDIRVY